MSYDEQIVKYNMKYFNFKLGGTFDRLPPNLSLSKEKWILTGLTLTQDKWYLDLNYILEVRTF